AHPQLVKIHRTRVEAVHLRPRLALVLGAEDAALPVLDDRVDDVGVLAVHVESDAARFTCRQAGGDLAPRAAGVDGLVDARVDRAAVEAPSRAATRGRGGAQRIRISTLL